MKKLLKNILLFGIFTITFYVIALFFLPPFLKPNLLYFQNNSGYIYNRLHEVRDFNKVDILFLGTSKVYRGFDTRIFLKNGYSTYNLGTSAQTPVESNYLLHRYLPELDPKVIVIEVSPLMLTSDGVESAIELISYSEINSGILKMALQLNDIRIYNTLLYTLIRKSASRDKNFISDPVSQADKYVHGGFVEHTAANYRSINPDKIIWVIKKQQLDCFKEMISFLSAKKKKIMLVQAPINQSVYRSFASNKQFDSIMKATQIPYYNFNDNSIFSDTTDFYDEFHLNQQGVQKLDSLFIGCLKNK